MAVLQQLLLLSLVGFPGSFCAPSCVKPDESQFLWDESMVNVSLLQHSMLIEAVDQSTSEDAKPEHAETPQVRSSASLAFIHIPKNAGTTIEKIGMVNGIRWGKWAEVGPVPKNVFEMKSENKTVRDVMISLGPPFPDHLEEGMAQVDKQDYDIPLWSNHSACDWAEVPPRYLLETQPNINQSRVAAYYRDSDTFCVTRDPYDRIVSQYRWWLEESVVLYVWSNTTPNQKLGGFMVDYASSFCSVDALNSFVQIELTQYLQGQSAFYGFCHYVPQSEYIWGRNGYRWCRHALRIADLPDAFDSLMVAKGLPIRFEDADDARESSHCPSLSAADLTVASKTLIRQVYRDDFVKLHYQL